MPLFFNKKSGFTEANLESVIKACLAKNQQAQKALIGMFFSYAKGISHRYAGNEQEAEEIINDGFLKVFNNLDKYDHTMPFKAWLRTIVVNTAIDHYRKNQKYTLHLNVEEVDIADFNEDVIDKISAEEILSLVQQLPPSYRMVFTLYAIDGYTHKEIASMMQIQEGTSKSNLQDARKKLQRMIKNTYPHLYFAHALKHNKINEN